MKKLIKIFTAVYIIINIVISLSFAWTEKKDFISQEKAWKFFFSDPNIKLLTNKWAGSTGAVRAEPSESNPYYSLYIKQDECGNNTTYPVCESYTVHMDAYTGKILYSEDMQKKISAIKESSKLIENEKPFMVKLKKAVKEVENSHSLGKQKSEEAIQTHLSLFLEALNKETPDIRSEGIRIIERLSNNPFFPYKTEAAIPRLIELLQDADYGVRYEAAEALGSLGKKDDERLIKAILPLLKDYDALVRRGAIDSLSKIGNKSLVPIFIPLLGDISVNQNITRALGSLGDQAAVEPLISLFNSRRFSYLEKDIIQSLGDIKSKQAIPFLLNLFNKQYTKDTKFDSSFESPYPYMGVDAARALVNIGKDTIPYIKEFLGSSDNLNRLYAAYALGLLKDTGCIEPLGKALAAEEDFTVKEYLENAIAEIKVKKFVSTLLKYLKVTVRPSKDEYRLGEPIAAFIHLENTGPVPIVVNIASMSFPDLAFEIITPDGRPAMYIGPMYSRTCFAVKDTLITLTPKKSYKLRPLSLQGYYSFNQPGKYKLTGIYTNGPYCSGVEFGVYALVGTVKSETAEIEIK